VVVVFPASMWAMMPMLRYRSSGVSRAMDKVSVSGARLAPGSAIQRKSGATDPDLHPEVSLRAHSGLRPE
jgi:hypothetical protein